MRVITQTYSDPLDDVPVLIHVFPDREPVWPLINIYLKIGENNELIGT